MTHRLFRLVSHRLFALALLILIFINIGLIITDSLPELSSNTRLIIACLDELSLWIFVIEYLVRFVSSGHLNPKYIGIKGKLLYLVSPLALLDLLAILPFLLPLSATIDLRMLRLFRILRIVTLVLKSSRYSKAIQTLGAVFRNKAADLLITVVLAGFLILIASSTMYYIEGDVQPEAFPSIPHTMWWAVATLTTVGYGDVYPVTETGRFISSLIAILGIGLVALPAGILGSGYIEYMDSQKKADQNCPHCGKKL